MVVAMSVKWSLGGSTEQDPRKKARENKCYQGECVRVSPEEAGIWGQFKARGDSQARKGSNS